MRSDNETSQGPSPAKGAFRMRAAHTTRLLVLGGCLGCYVQPYNPPPAQYGATQQETPPPGQTGQDGQPQPRPDQQQPPPDPSPQPPPTTYAQPSGWVGQPPPAQPAAPPSAPGDTGPVYENVNVRVAGNDVPSIDVFYNDLAPYGSWYNDPTYGWVFAPPSPSYVPYSNGHWAYTDYGYTWQSADPFGWATDHYGRWVWANRWVWRPDTTWGPAWVQWRQGDGYVGWAPAGYTDDAYVPETSWRFVGAANIFAPDVPRYYVTGNVGGYLRGAVPVRRYVRNGNQTWVGGPSDDWLRRYRVQPRREAFDPGRFGRYNDQQRVAAERRAREHQRDWDARRNQDEQFRREMQARQQRADEGRRRQAEDQRRVMEQHRRTQADQQRQFADQQRRQQDDQRRQEQERQRQMQDQQRQQAEQQRRMDEENRRRAADDQRRMQEQQR